MVSWRERMRVLAFAGSIVLAISGAVFAAGEASAPAIDISNAQITVTNGPATSCIQACDDVEMEVSGAVDNDDCSSAQPGNRISLAKTRWEKVGGLLDSVEGCTNKWEALETGPATVRAFFNDIDDGELYNDDESSAVTITVTGFKVGCLLTTADFSQTIYNDNSTVGDGGRADHEYSFYFSEHSGSQTQQAPYSATWQPVVFPVGTAMKGKIKIHGYAGASDVLVRAKGVDNDADDDGNHSITIGLSYLVSFSYTRSWSGDECVAGASAGFALQSDESWLQTISKNISDVSDNTDEWKEASLFSYNTAEAGYTCQNLQDVKRANFMAGGRADILETDPEDDASGYVEVTGDCWFGNIPPEYVPVQ